MGRIVEVGTTHYNHISAAVTQESRCYMWGQCRGQSGSRNIRWARSLARSNYYLITRANDPRPRLSMLPTASQVVSPTETPFICLHDVFACFATPSVTFLPMETEVSTGPSVYDSLKLAFDDQQTADVR